MFHMWDMEACGAERRAGANAAPSKYGIGALGKEKNLTTTSALATTMPTSVCEGQFWAGLNMTAPTEFQV